MDGPVFGALDGGDPLRCDGFRGKVLGTAYTRPARIRSFGLGFIPSEFGAMLGGHESCGRVRRGRVRLVKSGRKSTLVWWRGREARTGGQRRNNIRS